MTSDKSDSIRKRLETVLEDLIPMLRRDLLRRFPQTDENVLRESVKDVLSEVLDKPDRFPNPRSIMESIYARVMRTMS